MGYSHAHRSQAQRLGRFHWYERRDVVSAYWITQPAWIDVTIISPRFTPDGWPFAKVDPFPGAENDPLYGASYLKEIYYKADPNYSGRCVVTCRVSIIL